MISDKSLEIAIEALRSIVESYHGLLVGTKTYDLVSARCDALEELRAELEARKNHLDYGESDPGTHPANRAPSLNKVCKP